MSRHAMWKPNPVWATASTETLRTRTTLLILTIAIVAFFNACGAGNLTSVSPPSQSFFAPPQPQSLATAAGGYKAQILSDLPSAYYRLDETSGSVIRNLGGNLQPAILVGSAAYGVSGALASDPDSGLGFTSGQTWITSTITPLRSSYTLEIWFKTSAPQEEHLLDVRPQQLLIVNGKVWFGCGGSYLKSTLSGYNDGRYHYAVATYDGTIKKLYVDGSLSNSSPGVNADISGSTVSIGDYFERSYGLSGSLDEVAIYNHPLTQTQISAHLAAAMIASPPPSPSPMPTISMKHVLTADYVAVEGATNAQGATLAPWLTWASTTWQNNANIVNAGIKAMFYTNPNRQQPGSPLYTSDETTFAHDCSGSRIMDTAYSNMYLMNPASTNLRALWQQSIAIDSVGAHWDAIFEDDTNDVYGVTALPCGYSTASWTAASTGEISFLGLVPVIFNGLVLGPEEQAMNDPANSLGGMYESCYADATSRPTIWNPYWTDIENAEIYQAQHGKLFFCYGRDYTAAPSAVSGRIYTEASFLMTYDPATSVLWERYSNPSKFEVEPESELVALNPLLPEPSSIGSLQLSTGVYGREYANCYLKGTWVSACAVVVNPDHYNAHAYPYGSKYMHTLTLSGGGVLDLGSISAKGPSPGGSLAPTSAVIVFR